MDEIATTDLYANYDGTVEEVAVLKAESMRLLRRFNRDCLPYNKLPWQMEDLPGTTWRNVHTCDTVTVQEIAENRDGELGPDPDTYINAMFSIGLWRGVLFCIEHWVRVDHLSPQEQVDWARARVAYCRQQQLAQQGWRQSKSATFQKQSLAHRREVLDEAIEEMQELAGMLGITITNHPGNIGIQEGEQLTLL